tara:strand:- start:1567 stop:4014 length:2448 start_codon:yes stop_codon:yes gene_type:complete
MYGMVLFLLLFFPALGTAAEEVTWTVQRNNGVLTVFRNEKPVILNILYNNDADKVEMSGEAMVPIARETGIHVYMMQATFPWPGDNQTYDSVVNSSIYTRLDARINKLFEMDPDAHILWRIAFWAPQDWREKYPDQMHQDENGKLPESYFPPVSYGSDMYFEKAAIGVNQVVRYLESSKYQDRFIGYTPMTGYTGEWNRKSTSPSRIADYSLVNQQRFREYLKNKYVDVAELNRQLQLQLKSFDEVRIPSEDQFLGQDGDFVGSVEPCLSRLYLRYDNHRVAYLIKKLCHEAKLVAPKKLVGTTFGYWYAEAQGGILGLALNMHLAFDEVASSPDLDFFLSPPIYWLAGPDEPHRYHTLTKSQELYGKVYIAESDQPTHLLLRLDEVESVPILWTYKMAESNKNLLDLYRQRDKGKSKKRQYGADLGKDFRPLFVKAELDQQPVRINPSSRVAGNMAQSIGNIYRQAMGLVAQPLAGMWWWDMEGCVRGSTGGVAYNHPQITHAMSRVQELLKQATQWNRTSQAQVLVVHSRDSVLYTAESRKGWKAFRSSIVDHLSPLGKFGAPYQDIYLEDLERLPQEDINKARLVLFVDAYYVPSKTRAWIKTHFKNQGRVLVWFYGSGFLQDSPDRGAQVCSDLIGIQLKQMTHEQALGCQVTNTQHVLTSSWSTENQAFGDAQYMVKPSLIVTDPQATILGVSAPNNEPVFASKQMSDWTSVYLPGGPLPVGLLRSLLTQAGGHLYTDRPGMQVWATEDCIGVYSLTSTKGTLSINLPQEFAGQSIKEWFSGRVFPVNQKGGIETSTTGDEAFLFIRTDR